jgi:hypothetical protein
VLRPTLQSIPIVMAPWVVLSTHWKLEDVQAALNVTITLLSITFIFTSARFFWHSSASRISQHQDIPLSSLLTFTTLGEVTDVIGLLKAQLLQPRYVRLTVQCLFILFFSLSAIFAGPISRYSTKVGETARLRSVQGHLASRSLACDVNDQVKTHEVFTSLENSKFPRDQLLDFLPDTNTNWVYNPAEWNSTYSAACAVTPETPIQLNATGNYVNHTLLYLYYEIPGLWNVLSPRFRRKDIIHDMVYDGVRAPERGVWDDVIFWLYVELSPANASNEDNSSTQLTSISLIAVYMKGAPEFNLSLASASDFDWAFGVGKIPEAYYTKVECDIKRNRPREDNNYWEAYPQIRTNCDLAKEVDIYWSAGAIKPSGNGPEMTISIPSGDELFRFYQSWMIAKDTYYPYPFTREISVRLKTVELSIVFIVVCGLILFVVLLGILHCGVFKLRHRKILGGIPETKVDWFLQSVQEAQCSPSSQLNLQKSDENIPPDSRLTKQAKSPKETWAKATYTWRQDKTTNRKGWGKVEVGNHSLTLASSPPPTLQLGPGSRPSDPASSAPPAPSPIPPTTMGDRGQNEGLTPMKPTVATTEKEEE